MRQLQAEPDQRLSMPLSKLGLRWSKKQKQRTDQRVQATTEASTTCMLLTSGKINVKSATTSRPIHKHVPRVIGGASVDHQREKERAKACRQMLKSDAAVAGRAPYSRNSIGTPMNHQLRTVYKALRVYGYRSIDETQKQNASLMIGEAPADEDAHILQLVIVVIEVPS